MIRILALSFFTVLSACAVREPGDGDGSVGSGFTVGTPTAGTGSSNDDSDADTDADSDSDTDADTGTDDTDSGSTDDSADTGDSATDTDTDDTSSDTGSEEDFTYILEIGWTSSVSGSVDVYAVNLSCPMWSDYFVNEVATGSGYADIFLDDLGCPFTWGDTIVLNGGWAGGTRYLVESTSYADSGQHVNMVLIGELMETDDTISVLVSDLEDDAYSVDHGSDPGGDLYIETPEDPTE